MMVRLSAKFNLYYKIFNFVFCFRFMSILDLSNDFTWTTNMEDSWDCESLYVSIAVVIRRPVCGEIREVDEMVKFMCSFGLWFIFEKWFLISVWWWKIFRKFPYNEGVYNIWNLLDSSSKTSLGIQRFCPVTHIDSFETKGEKRIFRASL